MQIWGDLAFEPDRLFAWMLFSARKQAFLEHLEPAGLEETLHSTWDCWHHSKT